MVFCYGSPSKIIFMYTMKYKFHTSESEDTAPVTSLCVLVAQLCPTLCDPMDFRTPGLSVHHQLPELAQTHVHEAGDAIQPSHPLTSTSPPTFDLSHIKVFSSETYSLPTWSYSALVSLKTALRPKSLNQTFCLSPNSNSLCFQVAASTVLTAFTLQPYKQ